MKRKVNLVGPSTLSITLPAKWVKLHGVQKGDELELEEQGHSLVISRGGEKAIVTRTQLNIRNLGAITKRVFDALYKKGIDEVEVLYDKPEQLAPVLESVGNEAKSFEVIKQSKGSCVIRSISELDKGEFESLVKRTIALLPEMMHGIADALQAKDYATLQSLVQLEQTNNRFTHVLRRSLNRQEQEDAKNALVLYALVEGLEKAADEMKYLCRYAGERKLPVAKPVLDIAQRTADFLDRFAELHAVFDQQRAVAFSNEFRKLQADGIMLLEKCNDAVALHYVLSISRVVYDFLGLLVALKY
jgi:phosphate uptake regulator